MPSISIRPATPADIPLILALIKELAIYEREPDAAIATPEQIHEHLFAPPVLGRAACECVIGELDGVAVGMVLFFMNFSTWLGKSGLYLEDLYVKQACRGHGVGKALLVHLAKIAHSRGCRRMEWSVLDWNTPAIDFYKSIGANPQSEWTTWRLKDEAIAKLAGA